MAKFRSRDNKDVVVEACKVRLNTPAQSLVDRRGIVVGAQLGEWVVRETVGDSPHNPMVVDQEFMEQNFVALDQAGVIDMTSNVTGIEDYDTDSPDDRPGPGPGPDTGPGDLSG